MFCYPSSPPQVTIHWEKISVYENGNLSSKLNFFYPSPRNTDLRSPYPIDLEKTNKSRKAPSYNSKRSVAVFSISVGAVISKSTLLPPAAVGSLFFRLLMSIFFQQRKKGGKGGRMMVPTESPRSWMTRYIIEYWHFGSYKEGIQSPSLFVLIRGSRGADNLQDHDKGRVLDLRRISFKTSSRMS